MCNSEIRNVDLGDPNYFDEVISKKFNFWKVDEFGNMFGKYGEEIPFDRLVEQNWLDHYLAKEEESLSKEFYFAFIEALKKAGFKKLIINIEDSMHPIAVDK